MMKKKTGRTLGTVVAIFIVVLSSCSQSTLRPVPLNGVILAFGDSLTYGTGASPGASYPEVLEILVKRKVFNSGVPGETSAEGRDRLQGVLDKVRPDLVLLCHGGNDLLRKMDTIKTVENIMEMIRMIRDSGSQVVLIGIPRPGLLPSTADFYKDIARNMKVPFEGTIMAEILSQGNLKSDYIHPNDRGYARIAEAMARFLKKYKVVTD